MAGGEEPNDTEQRSDWLLSLNPPPGSSQLRSLIANAQAAPPFYARARGSIAALSLWACEPIEPAHKGSATTWSSEGYRDSDAFATIASDLIKRLRFGFESWELELTETRTRNPNRRVSSFLTYEAFSILVDLDI